MPEPMDAIKSITRKRSEIEGTGLDAPVFQVWNVSNPKEFVMPGLFFTREEALERCRRAGLFSDQIKIRALSAKGKLASILQAHTTEDTAE